jgi:hypothetical protein
MTSPPASIAESDCIYNSVRLVAPLKKSTVTGEREIQSNPIPMPETQTEDVDSETVRETTPTNDNSSMFVYVIGGVSGVCVVALCVLVCMCTRKTHKNHAGSHDVYSKPRKTDVKSTPTDNNMYVRIDKPPFMKGTYYTRQ